MFHWRPPTPGSAGHRCAAGVPGTHTIHCGSGHGSTEGVCSSKNHCALVVWEVKGALSLSLCLD